jgi:hypothetical protein
MEVIVWTGNAIYSHHLNLELYCDNLSFGGIPFTKGRTEQCKQVGWVAPLLHVPEVFG